MKHQDGINGARIVTEAARVRATLGRSDLLVRLFDFLLQCSLAGIAPKEIEIAQQVFAKTTDFDMTQDASVRVYIHRLRRKIDDFYLGSTGPRLAIPKGEYRLVIDQGEISDHPAPDLSPDAADHPVQWSGVYRRWLILAVVVIVIVNALAWLAFAASRPVDPNRALAATQFWHGLADKGRPPFVVTGDYYIFGEAPDEMEVTRLVREFSINSREDLDRYLITHPDERGRLIDVNLHYLPASTARALGDLLPIVDAATTSPTKPWVLTGSELTPDTLRGVNILYIGFLSGLGILRDPVFEASGFTIGASYDELIDRATGKRYSSDWGTVADNETPHRDYAYLASFPGAAGNRILIVAGTRDAGVMQAAEIARDKAQLDQIARRVGGQAAFEALFEVRTLGNVNLAGTLVVARALRPGQPWKSGKDSPTFPDQLIVRDQPLPSGNTR